MKYQLELTKENLNTIHASMGLAAFRIAGDKTAPLAERANIIKDIVNTQEVLRNQQREHEEAVAERGDEEVLDLMFLRNETTVIKVALAHMVGSLHRGEIHPQIVRGLNLLGVDIESVQGLLDEVNKAPFYKAGE